MGRSAAEHARILSEFDRLITEAEQLIRDAEHWNGLPHNQRHTPLDVEADRVMLSHLRRKRAEFATEAA